MSQAFTELVRTVRRLRSPQGCPWDRAQTLRSLKANLVEECCEVVEAIERNDAQALQEELGDLLLQVLIQSQICSEQGIFTLADVIHSLKQKLIRRHPHVFGTRNASSPEEALATWESVKHAEKHSPSSAIPGLPRILPALKKAQKIQKRVAAVGFDWPDVPQILEKIREELSEVEEELATPDRKGLESELGDLLFAMVNLCRRLQIDAEEALQSAVRRFCERFQRLEKMLIEEGRVPEECDLTELDEIWEKVKKEG
ncbi:MAG TPA: nucleoside triphosphate pyrophosphohydrolase [Kiritimatiellae bacterium]|nr:nucleoside triphosphate pyrophosphohydrolase [Kiritimatiellia bacterium]